ncbi:unnamed protein product, partial [marine sediment metagenome]
MLLGQIESRPSLAALHYPDDPSNDRAFVREVYFKMMGYKTYCEEALNFHLSDAPLRVVSAPAQTGKSRSCGSEIVVELMPTIPLTSSLTW